MAGRIRPRQHPRQTFLAVGLTYPGRHPFASPGRVGQRVAPPSLQGLRGRWPNPFVGRTTGSGRRTGREPQAHQSQVRSRAGCFTLLSRTSMPPSAAFSVRPGDRRIATPRIWPEVSYAMRSTTAALCISAWRASTPLTWWGGWLFAGACTLFGYLRIPGWCIPGA
jgi:hypothetical protein